MRLTLETFSETLHRANWLLKWWHALTCVAGHASSLWLWACCRSSRVGPVDDRPQRLVLQHFPAAYDVAGVHGYLRHQVASHHAHDGNTYRPRTDDSGNVIDLWHTAVSILTTALQVSLGKKGFPSVSSSTCSSRDSTWHRMPFLLPNQQFQRINTPFTTMHGCGRSERIEYGWNFV